METSAKALQQEVDIAQRRYSTAETILKQITQERDSAVSQLGIAFVTIEQLKVENENLKDENNELRSRLEQVDDEHEPETNHLTAKGVSLRQNLDLKAGAAKSKDQERYTQMPDIRTSSSRAQARTYFERQKAEGPSHKDGDTMFDLSSRQVTTKLHEQPQKEYIHGENSQSSGDSVDEVPQTKRRGKSPVKVTHRSENAQNEEVAHDLTYLSFLDVGFICPPVHS